MSTVCVKFGEYRNKPVVDQTFTLVKGFQTGKKGNYITVRNEGHFPIDIDVVKIKVNKISDFNFVEDSDMSDVVVLKKNKTSEESDEQAMNRIASRFAVLDEMSAAAINGDIRAMIVAGPPGVGKSFGVETQLE